MIILDLLKIILLQKCLLQLSIKTIWQPVTFYFLFADIIFTCETGHFTLAQSFMNHLVFPNHLTRNFKMNNLYNYAVNCYWMILRSNCNFYFWYCILAKCIKLYLQICPRIVHFLYFNILRSWGTMYFYSTLLF